MIYCMSDIHGEYDRFISMLRFIDFSGADTLYILGDVIDRGHDGIKILECVIKHSNMIMILGNHEEMCLQTLGPRHQFGAKQLWIQNGGHSTYQDLVYRRNHTERNEIIQYLSKLPDALNIQVNNRAFHLVHGMPSFHSDAQKCHEIRLWGRPNDTTYLPIPNTIAIIGHTPTVYLNQNHTGLYEIWRGDDIICIDCGCGHMNVENRRLACIRLDDMSEFYI